MDDSQKIVDEYSSRLENIQTRWSLLRNSRSLDSNSVVDVRNQLLLRYAAPIRSYIQAIVQNEDEADELAQDVMLRFLQGDFAGADSDKGRFRDLLKTALRNMVRNHWKKNRVRKTTAIDDDFLGTDEPENDPWLGTWRSHLLDLAWHDLQQIEEESTDRVPYSVLKLRTDFPDEDSTSLANRLSKQLGKEMKPASYRQQLKRARDRFAEVLVREIVDGLDNPTSERIHDEVIAMDLYAWLKSHLEE